MTHQPSANKSKRRNTNQTYELPLPTFNFKTASFPPRSSTSKNHGAINYTPNNFLHLLPMLFSQRTGGGASHLQYLRDDLDWLSRRVARLMASKNEASPAFRKALAHSGRRTWRTSRCPGIPRVFLLEVSKDQLVSWFMNYFFRTYMQPNMEGLRIIIHFRR